ncbi:MAG: hypothetical protein LBK83_11275 [Treponema sp.]|jgi:hypothetical protein|nr:hypothetical protein [Treponema sp.]
MKNEQFNKIRAEAVLRELENALAWNNDRAHKEDEDVHDRAFRGGYEYGLERAIEIVIMQQGVKG